MAVVKFDPFRGFEALTRKMNAALGEFDKGFSFEYGGFAPRVDVWEDEKNVYMQAELPGVRKENVKITINEENVLTIRGEKVREEKVEDTGKQTAFIRMERVFGEFTRSFVLPDNVKRESINARYENGILHVALEKVEPRQPREIEVQIR